MIVVLFGSTVTVSPQLVFSQQNPNANSNKVLTGTGPPPDKLGNPGDVYLDTFDLNLEFYVKDDQNIWQLVDTVVSGPPGEDGTSCSVSDTEDGVTITCTDGTSATVLDGADGAAGADGSGCSVSDTEDGATITCDGTSATVLDGADGAAGADGLDGADGSGCSVSDTEDGVTITCDDGTFAIVDGTVTNEDLGDSGCSVGDVYSWDGDSWECDSGSLIGLSCADGQIPRYVESEDRWTCATTSDTLAGLSCDANDVPLYDGTAWVCSSAAGDTLAGLSCTSGEVAKWDGSAWTCAPDVDTDTDTLGTLSCSAGEVAKWNDSTGIWECASDNTGAGGISPQECRIGQVVTGFDANGTPICKNISARNNPITAVDTAGFVGEFTSIAIGTDGFPVVSYSDRTNFDLKVAKCGNVSCSSGNTITAVDTAGVVGVFTSIAIGTDGFPVVSYFDDTNDDLKVAKCGNVSCSSGNTITAVDTAGDVGLYTSIAIGTDGLPVVSYFDSTNGDLKVTKCGNVSCSSGNTITAVDTAGLVGAYTSITIGTDGFPVVSYIDGTNGDLKVTKCGNVSCSGGNTITAVDTGFVGQFTSIAIGTDGFPVVSYSDATNGDLKVAKCGNVSCSGGNTITAVDTAGFVGQFTSIAIGTDGLPVVSYSDATNGDLKVTILGIQIIFS